MPHTLLTLPPEIRDEIIFFVVSHCRPAPWDHKTDHGLRIDAQDIEFSSGASLMAQEVLYEHKTPAPAASGLLATNRQLRNETLRVLKHFGTAAGHGHAGNPAISHVLDVMFVEERGLFPTWIRIPNASRRLGTVSVKFRIMGTLSQLYYRPYLDTDGTLEKHWEKVILDVSPLTKGIYSRSVLYGTFFGPPRGVWLFYSLLERFLHTGPVAPLPHGELARKYRTTRQLLFDRFFSFSITDPLLYSLGLLHWRQTAHPLAGSDDAIFLRDAEQFGIRDREITVDDMVLDFGCEGNDFFLMAEPRHYEEWKQCHRENMDGSPLRDRTMRPEWLAEYISDALVYLLSHEYDTFDYACILYERIGQITLKVNGIVVKTFQLGEMLRSGRPGPVDSVLREGWTLGFEDGKSVRCRTGERLGCHEIFIPEC